MATEELSANPQMQLGGLLGEWPEDPDRQFVDRVESVRVDGQQVVLTCQTDRDETCTVRLTPYGAHILRLMLIPQGQPLDSPYSDLPAPMLMEGNWPSVQITVEEEPESVRISLGELTVIVQRHPWELRLLDSAGNRVVSEHRSDTNMRGWRRAKWLGYARNASGNITRTYEAFQLGSSERIFGLGEKFMPLEKRGQEIESWNWNPWGATNEQAYKNIPFFLSTSGYGCFVHSSRRVTWDLGSGRESSMSTSIETEDPRLDLFLIHGPEFPQILERYTALTGRPKVPPRWSFGFWISYFGYRSWEEVDEVVDAFREQSLPLDVVHLDPYWQREGMYADLVWDEARFPAPGQRLKALSEEKRIRVCLWVQPWIPETSEVYREGAAEGYFAKTDNGAVYHYVPTIPGNPPVSCGIVDFSNPAARSWYKDKLVALLNQGVAAFKTDFGEAISEDAQFANGMSGREIHNVFPILYNSCFYEAFEEAGLEPLVWGRSGWAGIQRFPVSWSGDQLCNFPSMVCTIWGGLSFGLSGGAFWGHDLGGFSGAPDPELYIRWCQWGLLSSHSRAHGTERREPWHFGPDAVRIFTKYANLRYRLVPYLYSCAHEAAATGLPVMRALVLENRTDPNAWAADTQYLLGPDLLVCPVISAGAEHQDVYLPKGNWVDFWTGETHSGGAWKTLPVSLEHIPLFVRAGAVLPFGPEEEWVNQNESEEITLAVYPDQAGNAVGVLRHDAGQTRFTYRDGLMEISGDPMDRRATAHLAQMGEEIPTNTKK